MKDIVSNALLRGLRLPEERVRSFLAGTESAYANGDTLLAAAASHFVVEKAALVAEVERFRHCNCSHGPLKDGASGVPASVVDSLQVCDFAKDVTLHVILHELGHALIREFDLPILANEETMADSFATHYLVTHLPERALDVLTARTSSLMIEAREVPRAEWTVNGEHNNDARRAFQIAAIAVAADADKYASVAKIVEMSDRDIQKAKDYGAEIHRSWRRILKPIWMSGTAASKEARVMFDDESRVADSLKSVGFDEELETVVTRFDWHSQITVRFVLGEGSAGWSRSTRTIKVPTNYIRRFIAQGKLVKPEAEK
jgi:hypothetical protein